MWVCVLGFPAHCRLGELKSEMKSKSVHQQHKGLKLVIWFNMGILYEDMAELGKATKFYKRICLENRFFQDAYLRLANLEVTRGNIPKALLYCD